MNSIDLFLCLVIVASIWSGWRRGLLLAGGDLLALAASLIFAFWVYPRVVAFAAQSGVDWGVWMAPIALVIAYLCARFVLEFILGRGMRVVPRPAHAHRVNRALGVLPGAANGLINATIVSMLLIALPLSDGITGAASESVLVNRFSAPAEWLEARLRPVFDPAIDRTLSRLTVRTDSRDVVKLPFTVQNPRHRPDLEIDMFARGYFSHITPEGEDPFDRLRRSNVRFLAAGENLALSRTLPTAHQGLMDSPGHRANILRPSFARVGIGIVDGGRHGLMVTQQFRN